MSVLVLAAISGAFRFSHGFPQRVAPSQLALFRETQHFPSVAVWCLANPAQSKPPPVKICLFGAPNAGNDYQVVVWGDSHAAAVVPAINLLAKKVGLTARQATQAACPPLIGMQQVDAHRKEYAECEAFNAAILRQILSAPKPKLVVLAGAWPHYTEDSQTFDGTQRHYLIDKESNDLSQKNSERVLQSALSRTVALLRAQGILVLLVSDVPRFEISPSRCVAVQQFLGRSSTHCVVVDSASARSPLLFSKRAITEIARQDGVAMLPADEAFCDSKICNIYRNGAELYMDWGHLNTTGSFYLGQFALRDQAVIDLFQHAVGNNSTDKDARPK